MAKQDTLYIYHNNEIIFKRAVNAIDSMTFKHNYTTSQFTGKVSDNVGNEYNYISINGVDWMVENLKTTTLSDVNSTPLNSVINLIGVNSASYVLSNDVVFYNFYEASSQNICPIGWNVPYTYDFINLNAFVNNNTELSIGLNNTFGLSIPANGYFTNQNQLKG